MSKRRRMLATAAAALALVLAGGVTGWAMTDDSKVGGDTPAGDDHSEHERADEDRDPPEGEGGEAHDDHGLAEHDSTGGREPTAEDEANADAFYDEVAAGTERYQDVDVAVADGYVETSANGGDGPIKHYMQRGGNPDRDEALDAESPSGLVYYVDENQTTLIGVVFVSRAEEPPQPGGPLTVWHDHSPMGCPEAHPDCPAADGIDDGEIPPRMMHVWLFEGADTFAHDFPGAIQGIGADGGEGHQRGDPLPFDF